MYPTRVEAQLDPQLSRWLWLIKWLLAIPHFFVLAFLWIAFSILSVIAFFSILFTARYPRSIFEFNLGVLRWTWRVGYYSIGAFGTDRYPPFTLADAPDYPAGLEVAYPERLSRSLVLVKWWLLAIPHYLIVGALVGGTWVTWQRDGASFAWPGLIGVLALIAMVAVAFSGNYPKGLFDLVLGLNRWVLRVAAYAGLMTDEYPPFRLDMGGSEPSGTLTVPPSGGGDRSVIAPSRAEPRGWTGGSIFALIAGALLSLMALGLLGAGGIALWADLTQRDAAGFISTPTEEFVTIGHAIVTDDLEVRVDDGPDWAVPSEIFGDARVRVTPLSDDPVFVGIAKSDDTARYLEGVGYATVDDFADGTLVARSGGTPASDPAREGFWVDSSVGTGTQSLRWAFDEGAWTVVVMNADGSQGIDIRADAGAEVPVLPWIAGGLLVVGGVVLLIGGALVFGATMRATRSVT
jgi:hypothetical protein